MNLFANLVNQFAESGQCGELSIREKLVPLCDAVFLDAEAESFVGQIACGKIIGLGNVGNMFVRFVGREINSAVEPFSDNRHQLRGHPAGFGFCADVSKRDVGVAV